MLIFEYNEKRYPWVWSISSLLFISEKTGISDIGKVSDLVDGALLDDETDSERLKIIRLIAHGGFMAGDEDLGRSLKPHDIDSILSEDTAFLKMVSDIMYYAKKYSLSENEKKKKQKKLQQAFSKLFRKLSALG